MGRDEKIQDLKAVLRDSMMNDPVRSGRGADLQLGSVSFGPALTHQPPGIGPIDAPAMFALDLSALPPAARPAMAAALQAAGGGVRRAGMA